ncbi:hypothetical protein D3C72_2298090 [compost metagenome]
MLTLSGIWGLPMASVRKLLHCAFQLAKVPSLAARLTCAGLLAVALRRGFSIDCQRSRSTPPIHWFRNSAVLSKSSAVKWVAA